MGTQRLVSARSFWLQEGQRCIGKDLHTQGWGTVVPMLP